MQLKQYPFYFKSTVVLFGLILLVYAMSVLHGILVPLAFSALLAVLLNPLLNRFIRWKIPRIPAILLTLLTAILIVAGIFYFLSSQIIRFGDDLPLLKQKMTALLTGLQQWLFQNFGIAIEKQMQLMKDALNSGSAVLGRTISGALGTVTLVFLIPVYIFLFLFYKPLIVNFLYEVFAEENAQEVGTILGQTKSAIQSYLVGLTIEAAIVGTLNAIALLILGVPYAILLGVISALLNILPYVGGLIAILLPLLVATMYKDGYSTQIGILISAVVIQFVDNNFLVPRIVASKVKINALVSIIIVLLGGALWGIAGMFLSIPFLAVLKIIFDRVEGLKPWGKLLGDEVPTRNLGQIWGLRKSRKKPETLSEQIVEGPDGKTAPPAVAPDQSA